MRRWQLVIDDTGSEEGIYAFIYCAKWRSGQVLPMSYGLTNWLTTLRDRATQLLIKYKSGALVTQSDCLKFKLSNVIRFENICFKERWFVAHYVQKSKCITMKQNATYIHYLSGLYLSWKACFDSSKWIRFWNLRRRSYTSLFLSTQY